MGDPVVHFELASPNADEAGKFYAELFGWKVQSVADPEYTMIDTASGDKGINGGIGGAESGENSVRFYVGVPDLDATLAKIEKLGGKTVMPPSELPMVTLAMFSDPDGNILGLVKSAGVPPRTQGSNPSVSWFEVMGKDGKSIQKFYSQAFGWDIKSSESEGLVYGQVDSPGGSISGGIGASPEGTPNVGIYVEVDDLQKYLDKAAELGAKTVMEPSGVDPNTTIAIFADPQGNQMGMYTLQR